MNTTRKTLTNIVNMQGAMLTFTNVMQPLMESVVKCIEHQSNSSGNIGLTEDLDKDKQFEHGI